VNHYNLPRFYIYIYSWNYRDKAPNDIPVISLLFYQHIPDNSFVKSPQDYLAQQRAKRTAANAQLAKAIGESTIFSII